MLILALNLKIKKSFGYELFNSKNNKIEHNAEWKETEAFGKKEEDTPTHPVTHANIFLHSLFIWSSGLHQQSLHLQLKRTLWTLISRFQLFQREYNASAKRSSVTNLLTTFWTHLCLSRFLPGRRKCFVNPIVLCCLVNWGLIFFHLRCALSKNEMRLQLIVARFSFYSRRIATTPKIVKNVLIQCFALIVLLSRMLSTRNASACLQRHIWGANDSRL